MSDDNFRNELFGDDDFDDLSGDDFDGTLDDDFGFDDNLDFDDDFGGDDLFGGDDFNSESGEFDFAGDDFGGEGGDGTAEGQGGGNRTFIILAGILVFILLLGFGLIAFLALNQGPSEVELQATQIAQENATVEQQIFETQTQNAIGMEETAAANLVATEQAATDIVATETQAAVLEGEIATATAETLALISTETAVFEATVAQADAFASATVVALTEGPGEAETQETDGSVTEPGDGETTPSSQDNIFASATAVALTQQGGTGDGDETPSKETTPTPEGATEDPGGVGGQVETEEVTPAETEDEMPPTSEGISLPAVQQTATALAELFNATPTPEIGLTDQVATPIPGATAIPTTIPGGGVDGELPDTGLFDDVFQGNPAAIFLLAVGLLGVIAVTRGLRSVNRRRDDE
jgi:hypothetical protein